MNEAVSFCWIEPFNDTSSQSTYLAVYKELVAAFKHKILVKSAAVEKWRSIVDDHPFLFR